MKNHFTQKEGGNKYKEGIEDSGKRLADFSCLVSISKNIQPVMVENDSMTFDPRGRIYQLPDELMIPISYTWRVANSETDIYDRNDNDKRHYQVVPVKYDEYLRLMSKPSADPLKNQVWMLMGNSTSGNGTVEIVPHWRNAKKSGRLTVRYIRRPYPIILEDLASQDLSIEGYTQPYSEYKGNGETQGCELAVELHPEILQRAVEIAKVAYTGQAADLIQTGNRSE